MSRLRIPLAPVAAGLALALSVGVLLTELAHGAASAPKTASAILGGAAAVVALWHYDRMSGLAVADALLAGAVLVSMWGMGGLFVFPLLAMVAATLGTPVRQPRPKHLAPAGVTTTFVAGPVRRPVASIRRAGTGAVSRLRRSEAPPLRRTA
jgi:hypothetical protein